MTETAERPHLITDAEKVFAFMAAIRGELRDIADALDDDQFTVDMYGDDPNGVYGKIQTNPFQPNAAANIFMNYNGPYIIETILASWNTGAGAATGFSEGNVTSPAAGTTITSVLLTPGEYQVNWEVGLAGTVGAIDANNFQLFWGANILNSVNPGTAGGPWPQEGVIIDLTAPLNTVGIKNNGIGTVGAIYSGQLTATPLAVPQTVTLQLKDRTYQLVPASGLFNPQGLKIQMDRDDLISLTVTPKQACHLELMGHVDRRVRETRYR